jgi:hypothetical protein
METDFTLYFLPQRHEGTKPIRFQPDFSNSTEHKNLIAFDNGLSFDGKPSNRYCSALHLESQLNYLLSLSSSGGILSAKGPLPAIKK